MKETEERILSAAEQKRRIRERYKGVDPDSLDVIPAIPQEDFYKTESVKRVAVYARVSTDDPRQTSSYELQKNHYEDVVSRRPNWQLVKIYADEGISGTSLQHRDSFIEMISDCKAGKIDLIVTKSVSRFARNVLDCIGYVRELKALDPPVGVFFETENIYTLNSNSEMSLSFISTLAQEESHTKSEIMNASIEMRFKRGIFLTPPLYGYDQDENGDLVINEEEAKTVRLIFFMFLYGYPISKIVDTLIELGIPTKKGNSVWRYTTVSNILQNERHCGDVLARKTFTPNYLDHKSKKNRQDRNQYRSKDHHEAIISRDDFIAVQRKLGSGNASVSAYLPKLSVVPEGTLKGFVLINPRWAGFKAEDYLDASAQAGETEEIKEEEEIVAEEGDFDLRGYEVVRGSFFKAPQKIFVAITNSKLTFSNPCYRRMGYPEDVELLVHPKRKLLALRKAPEGSRDRYEWARRTGERYHPRALSGKTFLPALFALFGWNKSFRYKITGSFLEKDDASLLLFDAKEAEALIPQGSFAGNKKDMKVYAGRGSVYGFPKEWGESFGREYYENTNTLSPQKDGEMEVWKLSEEGVAYGEKKISPTDSETLQNEIAKIVKEIRNE